MLRQAATQKQKKGGKAIKQIQVKDKNAPENLRTL